MCAMRERGQAQGAHVARSGARDAHGQGHAGTRVSGHPASLVMGHGMHSSRMHDHGECRVHGCALVGARERERAGCEREECGSAETGEFSVCLFLLFRILVFSHSHWSCMYTAMQECRGMRGKRESGKKGNGWNAGNTRSLFTLITYAGCAEKASGKECRGMRSNGSKGNRREMERMDARECMGYLVA